MSSRALSRATATTLAVTLSVSLGALWERPGPEALRAPTAPRAQGVVAATGGPLELGYRTVAVRSPRMLAVPTRAVATYAATGDLVTVAGRSLTAGSGPLRRYRVQVERGLVVDAADVARQVQATLGDARGWGHGGRLAFQRVDAGPVAFTVVLAGPATTNRLCAPLRTAGIFSCYQRGKAVLNARRWFEGATTYSGRLAEYRQYLVSHEVGHALGHGHAYGCDSQGRARTMIQQTKSLRGCSRNAWPFP